MTDTETAVEQVDRDAAKALCEYAGFAWAADHLDMALDATAEHMARHRQSAPDSAQAERMAADMGFNSLEQAMWKLSAFMKGKDSALVVSKDTFRAKTMIELKGAIYDAHGWRRQAGESMGKRVAEHFDVVLDHSRGDFVARRKATPTTQAEADPLGNGEEYISQPIGAEPVSDDVVEELKGDLRAYDAAPNGDTDYAVDLASTVAHHRAVILATLSRPDGWNSERFEYEHQLLNSDEAVIAVARTPSAAHPFNAYTGHLCGLSITTDRIGDVLAANSEGIARIAAERRRQIEQEGWTPEHDDEHNAGEFCAAAACYALAGYFDTEASLSRTFSRYWPWDGSWWKPKSRLRNLERAGALIAAEIDRIKRETPSEGG